MADKGISYEIVDGFDKIFDEKGNTFLALRRISWNGNTDKYDLRRWRNNAQGDEMADKGFTFLTEEGPHELTKVLLDSGFGHTVEVINSIKDRDDFKESILTSLEGKVFESTGLSEEYFNPTEIFGDDEDE